MRVWILVVRLIGWGALRLTTLRRISAQPIRIYTSKYSGCASRGGQFSPHVFVSHMAANPDRRINPGSRRFVSVQGVITESDVVQSQGSRSDSAGEFCRSEIVSRVMVESGWRCVAATVVDSFSLLARRGARSIRRA